jgi:WXXGXW repeat (2 copies)
MRILRAISVPLAVAAAVIFGNPAATDAQVALTVAVAPPPLPVYAQPPLPGPGYFWTPGYWAYGPAGYYWVPGTWVLPPAAGLLWTPCYWGWGAGGFVFHAGFWGPTVGFYGGINYGFGYFGTGFAGGYWAHGAFFYNRAMTNIGYAHITNVYNRNVTVNRITNVSYNGGVGGTAARPTAAELAVAHRGLPPTPQQLRQQSEAGSNRALLASVNHGKPPIAATAQAGAFTGRGVEAARGAEHLPAGMARGQPTGAGQGSPQHRYAGPQQHHYARAQRTARPPAAPQRAEGRGRERER